MAWFGDSCLLNSMLQFMRSFWVQWLCSVLASIVLRETSSCDFHDVAKALFDIGSVAQANGNLIRAEELCKSCYEREESVSGHNMEHIQSIGTFHCLEMVSFQRSALDEAENRHHKSLNITERIHYKNVDHLEAAAFLLHLGGCMKTKK